MSGRIEHSHRTAAMSALPAEFVEREYNLRAAFPDHPQWFARWAADSAAARGRLDAHLDVRYGSGPKQTMDLFPAANARGTLLFIHGGYWRALDKADHSFVAPPLVAGGVGVAVLNYDLCPEVGIARIVDECREAVVWLQREGPRHGLAMQRLAVSGHSAGGHLAAMLVATDWRARGLPADPIAGAVAISGVFDLEPLVQVSFNIDLKLDAGRAYLVSPIHLQPRAPVPVLIAAGAEETSEFIRQSWLLWERWPECHPPRRRGPLFIPGRHHFSVVTDLGDPASELVQQTLALL
jgi:arylformamidase